MRRTKILSVFALLTLLVVSCGPKQPPPPDYVIIHPEGKLYLGDQVSFQVLPPEGIDSRDQQVQIALGDKVISTVGFGLYGVGERTEATFWFVWDTSGMEAGDHSLTFSILPNGYKWEQTITLLPVEKKPAAEADAYWVETTSACCSIYYITGTDAERDIDQLKSMLDTEAANAESRLQIEFSETVMVTFMPRVLGHGGFAADGIYVSYLDRNYAGSTTEQVVFHEMAHILDLRRGGAFLPRALVEGMAVYIAGGHFKPEPLVPRAAALIDLGWYIPLRTLFDDFYPQQHEIGYLEAGALIEYMVQQYGWEAYNAFYRDIDAPQADQGESHAVDGSLQAYFGITFDQLEANFVTYLKSQVVTDAHCDDVRMTVAFYDTVRRYQSLHDPSAYFMYAWVPFGPTLREKNIVADYLRHPNGWKNRAIESLLVDANQNLVAGKYSQVKWKLDLIDWLLDLWGG
jgi:hypothetical protein